MDIRKKCAHSLLNILHVSIESSIELHHPIQLLAHYFLPAGAPKRPTPSIPTMSLPGPLLSRDWPRLRPRAPGGQCHLPSLDTQNPNPSLPWAESVARPNTLTRASRSFPWEAGVGSNCRRTGNLPVGTATTPFGPPNKKAVEQVRKPSASGERCRARGMLQAWIAPQRTTRVQSTPSNGACSGSPAV